MATDKIVIDSYQESLLAYCRMTEKKGKMRAASLDETFEDIVLDNWPDHVMPMELSCYEFAKSALVAHGAWQDDV